MCMRSKAFVAEPFCIRMFIFVMIARSQRLQSPKTPSKSMQTHSTRSMQKLRSPLLRLTLCWWRQRFEAQILLPAHVRTRQNSRYKKCQTVQRLKVMVLFISPGFTSSLSSPRHRRCTKAADLFPGCSQIPRRIPLTPKGPTAPQGCVAARPREPGHKLNSELGN